jgi:hypothetical protein
MFESANDAGWSLGEGHTGQFPFQLRLRLVGPDFARELFPRRLNVFWSMQSSDDDGLPTHDELAALHRFEDRLVAAVEEARVAMLVAVITGSGEREFVFQASDPEQFLRCLTEMPQEEERYPVEMTVTDDPDWAFLDQLSPGPATDDTGPTH